MKLILALLFLSFFNGTLFAQVPKGRYFNNIKGSVWQSGSVDKMSFDDNKAFYGLTLVELDSIETSTTLWIFEDALTIVYYDSDTKKSETVLECDYTHNTGNHTLTVLVNGEPHIFKYTSVSTGAFITLSKKKK